MPQNSKNKKHDAPATNNDVKDIHLLAEDEKSRNKDQDKITQSQEDIDRKKERQAREADGKNKSQDEPPFQKRDLNEDEEY